MLEILDPKHISNEAESKFNNGDFMNAAREFEKAAKAYALAGDEVHSAEMENNSSVSYLHVGEPKLALEKLEHSDEIFQRSGDQYKLAIEMGNRGAALDALGKFEEALHHYRSSANLFNIVGDDDLYIVTIQAISSMQLRKGKFLVALETMQVGLSSVKKPTSQQKFLNRLFDIPLKILGR